MTAALRPVRLVLPLLFCLLLAGCGSRVPSDTIRSALMTDNLDSLTDKLEDTQKSYGDFVSSLNLARVLQIQGKWKESIAMYDEALTTLEGYEARAVVNIRAMAADVGTILFSRGAEEYYGTGYERSLLHTFNAINYAMLGDFAGAAVEMRKMEKRQEYWLEESRARIEKLLENRAQALGSPDQLPQQYSMRDILNDKSIRNKANNYQDAFSYALGAILLRIAGDTQAASVDLRRAMSLDDQAASLFANAWGSSKKAAMTVPALTGSAGQTEGKPSGRRGRATAKPREDRQEVVVMAFTGLAPSLSVENVRIFFPAIGYLLVDLPAYKRPVNTQPPGAAAGEKRMALHPLLRTDVLAYRTLWDELRFEIGSAISRAAVRAGIAGGAYAVAASNKNTQDYAQVIGLLTTALLDLFASTMADSVRNWETLPNIGYLALSTVPRGTTIRVGNASGVQSIDLPPDARGVIIMVTELSNNNLKVHHVPY